MLLPHTVFVGKGFRSGLAGGFLSQGLSHEVAIICQTNL